MRLVRKRCPYGIMGFRRRLGGWLKEQIVLRPFAEDRHGSILLVNQTICQSPEFVPFTKEALALIEAVYPRGYRRIQKEIRYIISCPLLHGGKYEWQCKGCYMDFERVFAIARDHPQYEWNLAAFAALLLHEATHGRIASLSIPYNKQTRVRIERICRTEERRFTARLSGLGKHYDLTEVVPPFDASSWEQQIWNRSPTERRQLRWKRFKEDWKRHRTSNP